jgi:hypothetical protein
MKTIHSPTILKYSLILTLGTVIAGCRQDKPTSETTEKPYVASKHFPRRNKNGATYAEDVNSGKIQKDDFIGSPVRTTSATLGDCRINIRYSSPGVRGRVIWGKLVPYNKVWVSGANHATKLSFNKEIVIHGNKIPAGQYALFTIPGRVKWTIILNKEADQHSTDDYDTKDDVIRFDIVPETQVKLVQRLTYRLEKSSSIDGKLIFEWEKIKLSIPISKPK